MEEEVRERLKALLADNKLSITKLFGKGTAKESQASRQLKSAALTVEFVFSIIDYFEDVSLDWVFRGIGNMYCKDNTNTSLHNTEAHLKDLENILNNSRLLVDALNAQIESQKKIISLQEMMLMDKK